MKGMVFSIETRRTIINLVADAFQEAEGQRAFKEAKMLDQTFVGRDPGNIQTALFFQMFNRGTWGW